MGIVAVIALLTFVVFLNFLQMASVVVYPFSRKLFRFVNKKIAELFWWLCIQTCKVVNFTVELTGDELDPNENALVIANHQSMTDIVILFFLAHKYGRLDDLKWFVKHEFKYVPGPGWGLQFLNTIFVKRNWFTDAKLIEESFANILKNSIPCWLVIFPEGTRKTPEKLLKSQSFAERNNFRPMQHLLFPRTKGFRATIRGLGNYLEAIYDVTITYPDLKQISLFELITSKDVHAQLHVKRFTMSEVILNSDLDQWLIDRFQVKDHFISQKK